MGIRAVDVAELTFEDYPSSAKHLLGKEGKGEKVNDPVLTLYYVGY